MNKAYAASTKVDELRSQMEAKRLIMSRGGESFLVHDGPSDFTMMFSRGGRTYRFTVPLPDGDACILKRQDMRRRSHGTNVGKSPEEAQELERGRLWRCLCLNLKAKFVAIDEGVTTEETELLPYVVMADGKTIAEKMLPALERGVLDSAMDDVLALPGRTQ